MQKIFLTRVTYKKSLDVVNQFLDAHRTFLDEQVKAKNIIASGGVIPKKGGFILSKHASYEEAEKMMQQDPFFVEDVAYYEITEWEPNRGMPEFFKCVSSKE